MVYLKMYAGYVTVGMKENLHFIFKIRNKKNYLKTKHN